MSPQQIKQSVYLRPLHDIQSALLRKGAGHHQNGNHNWAQGDKISDVVAKETAECECFFIEQVDYRL
jgi:hypothetical protein